MGFMKAIAGLVAATLLFAGSAVEASPWVVEVSPLVPEFTWTGCYLGLGIGGAWAHQTVANIGSVVGDQRRLAARLVAPAVPWVFMEGAIGSLQALGCWGGRRVQLDADQGYLNCA